MRLVFMLRLLVFFLVSCSAFALEPLRDREAILADRHRLLGPMPKTKAPLKMEVESEEKLPEFTRQYVRYQIAGRCLGRWLPADPDPR